MRQLQAIGRDWEITAIRAAAHRARDGRCHVVFAEGFAGSGKSMLVRNALHVFDDWSEFSVVLDDEHLRTPGYLMHHILRSFGVPCPEGAGVEDYVEYAQRAMAGVDKPTAIIVSRVHKMDEVSAAALLRLCTALQYKPVLLVLSAEPCSRLAVRRLSDYVRVNLHGTHVTVKPYASAETAQLLGTYISTPFGEEAVRRLHVETAGYPLLIDAVGRHLAETPLGRRSLDEALRAMRADSAWLRMRSAVSEMLQFVDPARTWLLELLAAAQTPLSKRQLEAAARGPVDFTALLESGLALWDDTVLGYAPRDTVVAQLLINRCSTDRLVRIHQALIDIVTPVEALSHRVQVLRSGAEPEQLEPTIGELRSSARQALVRHDIEAAYEYYNACVQLRADEHTLADMLDVAVPLGRKDHLLELESELRGLPSGPLRQGALAILALEQGDTARSVEALEAQREFEYTETGALVFAQAVAEVAFQLTLYDVPWKLRMSVRRGVAMLDSWERDLNSQAGDAVVEMLRARVNGVRAFIRLWDIFSRRDPVGLRESLPALDALVDELGILPGTDVQMACVRAVRAVRRMHLGERDNGYPDLLELAELQTSHHFVLYIQTQLALLLFSASYWDEAEEMAFRAAGRAMLSRESPVSLFSYLVAAVTRGARDRWEDVDYMIETLGTVRTAYGPLVAAVYDWTCAIRAESRGEQAEVAGHLLRMRDEPGGWWFIGPEPMLLLVRSAHCAKAWALGSQLRRSVLAGDIPLSPELSQVVALNYFSGFAAWARGDPKAAWDHLDSAMQWFLDRPPFRASQPHYEGGAFRLLMAILATDMAELFLRHSEPLDVHGAQARENLEWAVSVFQSSGAHGLLEQATRIVDSLEVRQEADSGAAAASTAAEPDAASGLVSRSRATPRIQPTENELLAGLTKRERQVGLRIAQGETNKEIAQTMGLSVRTVDFHVSNVLTKLRLGSRREVRQLLRNMNPS